MFSYQIQPTDNFSTFAACGYNEASKNTSWYFSNWSSGYNTPNISEFTEELAFPAQMILSGKLGTGGSNNRIVRLFYGPTFPTKDQIRIDVVNPVRDSDGKINPNLGTKTQTFPITWPAVEPSYYLTWFLVDVDGNNLLDLVAFVMDHHSKKHHSRLNVVVFPGQADLTFGTPIVTNIKFDNKEGTLFDAAFMKPINASQAQYTYTNILNDPPVSNAAIMSTFDYFGILGARILAPVSATGSFNYEMKGQTPAIAGQPSVGLGQRGNPLGIIFN